MYMESVNNETYESSFSWGISFRTSWVYMYIHVTFIFSWVWCGASRSDVSLALWLRLLAPSLIPQWPDRMEPNHWNETPSPNPSTKRYDIVDIPEWYYMILWNGNTMGGLWLSGCPTYRIPAILYIYMHAHYWYYMYMYPCGFEQIQTGQFQKWRYIPNTYSDLISPLINPRCREPHDAIRSPARGNDWEHTPYSRYCGHVQFCIW